jgi:spore photoproduct lyase
MKAVPIVSRRKFIKQFHGPPKGSNICCFRFWELVSAAGCPYQCDYCFLQATPSFVFGNYPLSGVIFKNWQDMLREVEQWLQSAKNRVLVVGELQEGMAFERAYKELAEKSLAEMLIPKFAEQERNRLLFLTKSVDIQYAKKMQPTRNVIFCWSVNSETAAKRWEKGAPSPSRRLKAAQEMKDLGWPVRLRLDPMIPHEGWPGDYAETVDKINALTPEMVTLGTLRASNTLVAHTRRNGRKASVFRFLREKDPSGFKWRIPYQQQLELYSFILNRLDPSIIVALCKEDRKVWNDLGMKFQGCNCLIELPKSVQKESLVSRQVYGQTEILLDPIPLAAKSRA